MERTPAMFGLPRPESPSSERRSRVWSSVVLLGIGCLLWLVLFGESGCTTSVCRSDQDCQAPTPRCVFAQCKACREDSDCPSGRCDEGACKSGESNQEDPNQEQGPEPSGPDGGEPPPDIAPETPGETPSETVGDGGCQVGMTRPCYGGPGGTADIGECKSGTQRCEQTDVWGDCQGAVLPSAEACDGKDNDCDGVVDNDACDCKAGDSRPCDVPQKQGECKKGTQTCTDEQKWGDCTSPTMPVIEACDGVDNDCDGKVDEICGPKHLFGVVGGDAMIRKQRGLTSVTTPSTGLYELKTTVSCSEYPMFLSVYDERRLQVAGVSCGSGANSAEYRVGIVERDSEGNPKNASSTFFFVIPAKVTGEVFGHVDVSKCNPAGKCKVSRGFGGASVDRVSTGVYVISASPCSDPLQPIFGSTTLQTTQRAIVAENKGGKCYLRIFDETGKLTNESFSFWLPNKATNVFVRLKADGTIEAKNDFGDQMAKWKVTVDVDATLGRTRYDVTFPIWEKDHVAVIHTPNRLTPKRLGVQPQDTLVEIYPFDLTGPLPPAGESAMSVLWVR